VVEIPNAELCKTFAYDSHLTNITFSGHGTLNLCTLIMTLFSIMQFTSPIAQFCKCIFLLFFSLRIVSYSPVFPEHPVHIIGPTFTSQSSSAVPRCLRRRWHIIILYAHAYLCICFGRYTI